jgi:hypothetical protein
MVQVDCGTNGRPYLKEKTKAKRVGDMAQVEHLLCDHKSTTHTKKNPSTTQKKVKLFSKKSRKYGNGAAVFK